MIEKISPAEFTWERWSGRHTNIDEVLNNFDTEKEYYTLKENIILLGYCFSKDLSVRPRTTGVSLLFRFKDNKEIMWIHAPDFGMKQILEEVEK